MSITFFFFLVWFLLRFLLLVISGFFFHHSCLWFAHQGPKSASGYRIHTYTLVQMNRKLLSLFYECVRHNTFSLLGRKVVPGLKKLFPDDYFPGFFFFFFNKILAWRHTSKQVRTFHSIRIAVAWKLSWSEPGLKYVSTTRCCGTDS